MGRKSKDKKAIDNILGDVDIYEYLPEEVWTCDCECQLFYITPEAMVCSECATPQVFGDYYTE